MSDEKEKRGIDDPLLNQDVDFDRKDEGGFDESDDFHKNDPTDQKDSPEQKTAGKATANDTGRFDGEIGI